MLQLGGRSCPLSLLYHETGKDYTVCLEKTYSRVQAGKHLSDMFPIKNVLKQGDSLLSLLFSFQ